MNKILAILCGVGLAAVVAVVAYITINKDQAVSNASPVEPRPPAARQFDAGNLRKRVVAESFYQPCAVAVQPETGHVFVSMVGRIVRVVPGNPAAVHDEVLGFQTDHYGRGPKYEFGPLGLAFARKDILVVGDGGQEDGKDNVRIYTVGAQPLDKDKVRKAEDMTSWSTPIPPGDDSLQGEGNFFGVAVHGSTASGCTVFVTSNGDDSKGWISKLELDLKKPAPLSLTPFIKSKELTGLSAPMGATMTPQGKLVVSQLGSTNSHPDSLLTFYDPLTGSLERSLPIGLHDLCGIAYSPTTGKLYGVDFSWADPSKGGLFLLEPGADQVQAVKIADLDKPTALAFSPAGHLYVTVLGAHKAEGMKTGQLLVFEGL